MIGASPSTNLSSDQVKWDAEVPYPVGSIGTIEALQAGIDATKPGNKVDDVAQAFWKVLDKYGIEKKSRTGYSIGIGYPPDWGEHTLNIYKGDMTLLEPNICFHMIAVMQFGDWGVEASEAIRVTEKGSELFCNLSKELHVKR